MEVRQKARGTTEGNDAYIGPEGQLTVDIDRWDIRVHDGATPGGHRVANLDYMLANFVRKNQESEINIDGVIGLQDALDAITARLDIIEANGWVTSARILDGTILTADLADGAVTLAKLAANSVNSSKIVDKSIQAIDIADGVIPGGSGIPGDGTVGAYTFAIYASLGSGGLSSGSTTSGGNLGYATSSDPGTATWASYGYNGTWRAMSTPKGVGTIGNANSQGQLWVRVS